MEVKMSKLLSLLLSVVLFCTGSAPLGSLPEKANTASKNAAFNSAINAEGMNLEFENDSETPWEIDSGEFGNCVRSVNFLFDSVSTITLNLNNVVMGATLNWYWQVSSEEDADYMMFLVNGEIVEQISGEVAWEQMEYTFPVSGHYTIQWKYDTDMAISHGMNCGWLDEVSFHNAEGVPAAGVEISPESASLFTGETLQMSARVLPDNVANSNVSWTSSAPEVASVSEDGIVTANTAGEAIITVTSEDGGFTASSAISVENAIVPIPHTEMEYFEAQVDSQIDFTIGEGTSTLLYKPNSNGNPTDRETYGVGYYLDLNEGDSVELSTIGDVDTVMWTFDADFNRLGYNDDANDYLSELSLVAPSTGRYYVLITGYDMDEVGSSGLVIEGYDAVHVTGVTVSPKELTLIVGRYGEFEAAVEPANADLKDCVWSVSDETVASIDPETGRVLALSSGVVTVTVTTMDGGFTDTAVLTVIEQVNHEYDGMLYGYNAFESTGRLAEGFAMINPDGSAPQSVDTYDYRLCGGEYYDGLIYAYGIELIGIYELPHYYIIDPATWTIQYDEYRNVCYDMAYDYSTNTMYGLNPYTDMVSLCIVDMATGEYTAITNIILEDGGEPMNLACDNAGHLYTISNNGNLYEIDKQNGQSRFICSTGKTFDDIQSMCYDHIERVLYVAQYNGITSNLIKIDPETGVIVEESPLSMGGSSKIRLTSLFAYCSPEDVTVEPPVPHVHGDVDGDGNVTMVDANIAARMALNLIESTPAADYDGDGIVNMIDATTIARKALNLI